jgi:hypothetical protein
MKYLYLLYADESALPAPGSPESEKALAGYNTFYQEVTGRSLFQAGDPVQPSTTATTVSVRGDTVEHTPGPARLGGEQIIGFYVLDVLDQEEAVRLAAKIPAAEQGRVEVRPILVLS